MSDDAALHEFLLGPHQIGDEVEIYDGDLPGWVPGVVDGISGPSPIGRCWMVKTEAEADGLPLTYALPMSRPEWIRSRDE